VHTEIVEQAMQKTKWLREAKFGIMVHWLSITKPKEGEEEMADYNEMVNRFKMEAFCQQVQAAGADYVIFPFGQSTGLYCSPNSYLEQILPGRCSGFDLALEIARNLEQKGIGYIAYLSSEVDSCPDRELRDAFGWDLDPVDKTVFQARYLPFIEAWSVKFGRLIKGWWFDGCYDQHPWSLTQEWSNARFDFPAWARACRKGNEQTLIAYNNGVGSFLPICREQDYVAGEATDLSYYPAEACVGYSQWHVLTYIDCIWGHVKEAGVIPDPIYTDEELFAYVGRCKEKGGAVTLNVGIYQDGTMPEKSIQQLERLAKYLVQKT